MTPTLISFRRSRYSCYSCFASLGCWLGLMLAFAACPANAQVGTGKKRAAIAKDWMQSVAVIHKDLAYIEGGHARQKLDLYLPKKKQPQPPPLLIWIHGGAWQGGDKSQSPIITLVDKGYALASINYRLSQHAIFPAQLDDCQAAISWLRTNAQRYSYNGEKIGVAGASAGGHLAALVGTAGTATKGKPNNSSVSAVVDYFGPVDFLTLTSQSKSDSTFDHDSANSPPGKLLGGAPKTRLELAKKASPLTYIAKDSPPFLILHGAEDPLVPAHQSAQLHAALKKAGVDSTLITVPGATHGPGVFTNEYLRKVEQFFDRHLRGGSKR